MYKKIFISHASENQKEAKCIYDFLVRNNYEPWLDTEKLSVGMNWDNEIEKNLKQADFVIIILSRQAVSKRSYIQREIKRMDRYSEEKLIDDIYILPILLDDCEIPIELQKYQYLKFDKNNLCNILKSLDCQRDKYLKCTEISKLEIQDCIIKCEKINLNLPFPVDFQANIYKCRENLFFDANYINSFINSDVNKLINYLRKVFYEELGINENEYWWQENAYLEISNQIVFHNNKFITVSVLVTEYFGGAHPNHSSNHRNFILNPERTIELYDVIDCVDLKEWLVGKIDKFSNDDLRDAMICCLEWIDNEVDFFWNEDFLYIDLTNHLPHAFKSDGILVIPKSTIASELKINIWSK